MFPKSGKPGQIVYSNEPWPFKDEPCRFPMHEKECRMLTRQEQESRRELAARIFAALAPNARGVSDRKLLKRSKKVAKKLYRWGREEQAARP